jgi:DNA repair exonuclease SbcCD ATPase subunit
MAAKKTDPGSPLIEAVQAFEEELSTYGQLSEAFQRAPLTSTKQLERANETLGLIAASEQRLSACGQRLAEAVGGVRDRQEKLARATLERVPAVKQRMEQLRGLLSQFETLGKEAVALNETAAALGKRGTEVENQTERARELTAQMHTLSQRAHELTGLARDADFEELANRAHALHQQLLSGYNKLKHALIG